MLAIGQPRLRNRARGEGPGSRIPELEVQEKLTPSALAGWSEFPALRCFEGQPGKVPARSRGIELSSHHAPCRINLDSYTDPDGALNCVAGALRHVWQGKMNDSRRLRLTIDRRSLGFGSQGSRLWFNLSPRRLKLKATVVRPRLSVRLRLCFGRGSFGRGFPSVWFLRLRFLLRFHRCDVWLRLRLTAQ